ncbi:MAG TPA: arabinan endo-1,5-alpha-L-arabinosidase [Bryobacteraceae bacterium]|nr:arabinan endo-1,5-alpha-L-arabinosidase [Bryobacteraceae bacterium]
MEPVTQIGRRRSKSFAYTGLALIFSAGAVLAQQALPLEGDVSPIHDPTMAREGSSYYVFSTNRYRQKDLPEFCSPDLHTFTFCGSIFDDVPDWAHKEIPGAKDIWAPDVKYVGGVYRVYYAVSTFGSNISDIGLVTNKTLDPKSPNSHWVDQGKVFGSVKSDDFNAIDPNLAIDDEGGQWLAFGSFWSGIKMHRIDPATGKLSTKDKKLYSLASRRRLPGQPGAIEAPYIVRHGRYYYLFVSFDQCCHGAQSTYRTMVGRADKITGPYKDKNGKSMMDGNATELLAGNDRWRGPGGESVLQDGDRDLLVFHAYDAKDGRRTLQISTLTWENDWPHAALDTR